MAGAQLRSPAVERSAPSSLATGSPSWAASRSLHSVTRQSRSKRKTPREDFSNSVSLCCRARLRAASTWRRASSASRRLALSASRASEVLCRARTACSSTAATRQAMMARPSSARQTCRLSLGSPRWTALSSGERGPGHAGEDERRPRGEHERRDEHRRHEQDLDPVGGGVQEEEDEPGGDAGEQQQRRRAHVAAAVQVPGQPHEHGVGQVGDHVVEGVLRGRVEPADEVDHEEPGADEEERHAEEREDLTAPPAVGVVRLDAEQPATPGAEDATRAERVRPRAIAGHARRVRVLSRHSRLARSNSPR